jgi:Fe-S cluster biogenesis protein NfuA
MLRGAARSVAQRILRSQPFENRDPVAESPPDLEARVLAVLDEVRPMLRADGGDIELVRIDVQRGRVEVRLKGACTHCAASIFTMAYAVEARVQKAIPSIQEVVAI